MCIIAVCRTRNLSKEEIITAWRTNSDGAGIAYGIGESTHIIKGIMKQSELIEKYASIPLPHVVHFRTASSGTICKELTHPFEITPNSKQLTSNTLCRYPVLFHNGTFTEWKSAWLSAVLNGMEIDGAMNDSRFLAMICGTIYKRNPSRSMRQIITMLESLGGKYAIVQPDGNITTIGKFYEQSEPGVWLSAEPFFHTYNSHGTAYYDCNWAETRKNNNRLFL